MRRMGFIEEAQKTATTLMAAKTALGAHAWRIDDALHEHRKATTAAQRMNAMVKLTSAHDQALKFMESTLKTTPPRKRSWSEFFLGTFWIP